MKKKSISAFWLLLFACSFTTLAQQKNVNNNNSEDTALLKPQKSITQGSVSVEGKPINYQAVVGTLILKNKENKPTCSMFYTAYFKDGVTDESQRPVTFIYSGGPGTSSSLLHIGAWGPRRVFIKDTQRVLPPYKTVNNDYSLLDASDLVFIDAPGTGFSQLITKEKGGAGNPKDFYNVDGDGQAFAQFITTFLSAYNRWNSPKYLFGESYGTFRSAVVANILETEDGVDLNGVILLSQIFTYTNMSDIAPFYPGDGLPYELALPSEAATAWYHHKVPNRPEKLEPFLKEVEQFAMTDYSLALNKGSLLDTTTFNRIAEKIHDYTGLTVSYIRKANLRVNGPEFEKMILTNENEITGRLDTRFTGPEMDPLGERPSYDPTAATIVAPFAGAFNNYLHNQLKFGKGRTYHLTNSREIMPQWDFRHVPPGSQSSIRLPNVMADLAHAMIYNPRLKVMLNSGYFDLTTPFYEGFYEMHHLPIPGSLQSNISYAYYYSGHFAYLHLPALEKLHDNVARFIEGTH